MPQSGDRCPGFVVEPMRCWAMTYDSVMQANHCDERPTYTGRWFSPRGDQWWRVWLVPITWRDCIDHRARLTGSGSSGLAQHLAVAVLTMPRANPASVRSPLAEVKASSTVKNDGAVAELSTAPSVRACGTSPRPS